MAALIGRILGVILALLPLHGALAAVGTIDSLEGDVRVQSAGGEVPGTAGLELQEGVTVSTGVGAWALLTMSDGASLTLRPGSRLKIDTYRYDANGKAADHSSVLSLAQGAFRAITGAIGKTNRDGYKVVTPTATIGIRGTDHEPAYFAPPQPGEKLDHDPGTYDKVNSGSTVVRNERGEMVLKRGQSGFVHQNGAFAPRLLQRPPGFYQQYAAIDKRAAQRRRQFHQRVESGRQTLQNERAEQRAQKQQERAAKQEQQRELREKKAQERREKAPRQDKDKQHRK